MYFPTWGSSSVQSLPYSAYSSIASFCTRQTEDAGTVFAKEHNDRKMVSLEFATSQSSQFKYETCRAPVQHV